MSDPIARVIAVIKASLEPRFPVASGAITIEHDDRGETQDSVFCLSRVVLLDPGRGCKRLQTGPAKSCGVRKTDRVCSRTWEMGFVARFGMTSCSPNFFNNASQRTENAIT